MKEDSQINENENRPPQFSENISYIKCSYDIKDYNETQIINFRGQKNINEEIESKVKIWNGEKAEKLIFKKKFDKLGINVVYFIIEEKLTNMSFLFNKCTSLKEVNFINVETNQVTNLSVLFQLCQELEYVDLSSFNTSNVTHMGWIFYDCHKLKEIKGLNNFNTNNVKNMYGMFGGCNELEYLDLTNFDTSNVTDMAFMFDRCEKLKEIKGINTFITIKVVEMNSMFRNCNQLEYLDLSKLNTSNVTEIIYMFSGCHQLKEIKGINNFNTEKVIKMDGLFQDC